MSDGKGWSDNGTDRLPGRTSHSPARPGQTAKIADSANLAPKPVISLILPVLNEAPILAEVLSGLPRTPDLEILLVDGGSTDGTRELAAGFPHVRWLTAPRGRGGQMNAGARAARGDFCLFLHVDTGLAPAHLAALRRAAPDPRFGAGAFELRLTPPTPFLRFIAWGANWRCRLFACPTATRSLSCAGTCSTPWAASPTGARKTWTW